jgi:CubicO group peptidase (beta-lactamase class C family)
VLLLALALGCAAPRPVDPRVRTLVDETGAAIDRWGIPGVAVVVVEGDRTWFASAGVLHHEDGGAVGPNARFRIGSVSKMLTGMLVADAVERGEVDLDAAPDIPELAGRPDLVPPTLRHFLRHESGLQPGGVPIDCDEVSGGLGPALGAAVPELEAWLPPDTMFLYSNGGVAFGGRAVEHAVGRGFPALVKERVFGPAGMTGATLSADEAVSGHHATGHRYDPETGAVAETYDPFHRDCPAAWPSGGLLATPDDLGALLRVLVHEGEGVLSPAAWGTYLQAEDEDPTRYGLGVLVGEDEGRVVLSHGGRMHGYLARLEAWPEDDFGVAVLVNADHRTTEVPAPGQRPTDLLAATASRLFLDLPEKTWPSTVRDPAEWAARYSGAYVSAQEDMETWTIWEDDGVLWLHDGHRDERHALYPYSRDRFQYPRPSSSTGLPIWLSLDFEADADGRPDLLVSPWGVGFVEDEAR